MGRVWPSDHDAIVSIPLQARARVRLMDFLRLGDHLSDNHKHEGIMGPALCRISD